MTNICMNSLSCIFGLLTRRLCQSFTVKPLRDILNSELLRSVFGSLPTSFLSHSLSLRVVVMSFFLVLNMFVLGIYTRFYLLSSGKNRPDGRSSDEISNQRDFKGLESNLAEMQLYLINISADWDMPWLIFVGLEAGEELWDEIFDFYFYFHMRMFLLWKILDS